MNDEHLPDVYVGFREQFPKVASALDGVGQAADAESALDEKTARLVKIGLAVGAGAQGAVRSNTRKALTAGATPDEVRHVALLAITTCGFPAAIAGFGWIDEVLKADG